MGARAVKRCPRRLRAGAGEEPIPGFAHDLLEPFHCHQIDLTRLETRPSRTGAWNYVFFIDFCGHVEEPRVSALLEEVRSKVKELAGSSAQKTEATPRAA